VIFKKHFFRVTFSNHEHTTDNPMFDSNVGFITLEKLRIEDESVCNKIKFCFWRWWGVTFPRLMAPQFKFIFTTGWRRGVQPRDPPPLIVVKLTHFLLLCCYALKMLYGLFPQKNQQFWIWFLFCRIRWKEIRFLLLFWEHGFYIVNFLRPGHIVGSLKMISLFLRIYEKQSAIVKGWNRTTSINQFISNQKYFRKYFWWNLRGIFTNEYNTALLKILM
jgi:hypothetical protein